LFIESNRSQRNRGWQSIARRTYRKKMLKPEKSA
jgi:hypothetical protein